MSRKLVIMASKEAREALRTCGVLPPSVFKKFAEIDCHDVGVAEISGMDDDSERDAVELPVNEKRRLDLAASLGFYVWPYDPDYKCEAPGFGDFPLLSMLGMTPPKNNAEYLERKVAYTKLLGSTILHVVLLDECDLGSRSLKPAKPSSVSTIVGWCDTLQTEIRREYSEEQAAGIEHAFILIARNPQGLVVDKEDVESFCRRMNGVDREKCADGAKIRTCFFMDRHLEVELGNQNFPSVFVWPQMVGRLLLRVLIGLETSPTDPIGWCAGGIRLWKSSEFVLDFQPERVHRLMSAGIDRFIKELRNGSVSAGKEFALRPWTPTVACALKDSPQWKCRDDSQPWNLFRAAECCHETFDESRWCNLLCPAKADKKEAGHESHDGDVDTERRRLTSEVHGSMTSADTVRDLVSGWVHGVSKDVRAYFVKGGGAGVSKYWDQIVQLCLRRAQCKDVLDEVVRDYESARAHYVQKKFCILAVVAVSLCAGLVFSRLILSLGGSWFLALMLCAGTFVGGMASMVLMLHLHDKYGRLGRTALLQICRMADDCITSRDKCAHDHVKEAVEIRARMLQLAKMRHFEHLMARLQNMITEELVAPSSEVFIEDDLPELIEDALIDQIADVGIKQALCNSPILRNQYHCFFRETNYRIGFEDKEGTAKVRDTFPEECDSVRTSWSALCAEHDPHSTANFPARYFVPFLRRTLKNFQDKYRPEVWRSLTEDSIDDLIAKFRRSVVGQKNMFEIGRRIRSFIEDDTCYSAHVDKEHKQGVDTGAELFYAPIFNGKRWEDVTKMWTGVSGVQAIPSQLMLGRTPHFAVIFEQSQVDFGVEGSRLVLQVAGARKEEENV